MKHIIIMYREQRNMALDLMERIGELESLVVAWTITAIGLMVINIAGIIVATVYR